MDGFRDDQGTEHVGEVALEPVTVVSKRRPRALWAVLAAVAVAAGALVVTSADEEGNQRPGLPVDLAGSSGGGRAAEAAADSSMMAWITYVPGDDLPALGGEATAYRLPGDVDDAQVRQLADALGLEGEVVTGDHGSLSIAGEGGRLDVYAGGGAYWSFSSRSGEECVRLADDLVTCSSSGGGTSSGSAGSSCEPGAECTVTTVVEGEGSIEPAMPPCVDGEDCSDAACSTDAPCVSPAPVPPAPDLPSEDEARQIAVDVVAASGADIDGARVTAEEGYGWYITVEPVIDGTPSGLLSYVEVGSNGAVVWGSGPLGLPESLGEYPLVDTRTAIERANEQSGIGVDTPLGAPEAMSSRGAEGGTDVGGTTGGDETVSTVIAADPCVVPEGASDGCGGGTTGCGDDGCGDVDTATTLPCKVQPDGREVCEMYECSSEVAVGTARSEGEADGTASTTGGTDGSIGGDIVEIQPCEASCAPPAADGPPESAECPPLPEPEPLEITLVDAEPSLVLLPATDGSPDAYLVPAYRFTGEDGSTVDLPAVSAEALVGPASTETTVPDTSEPEPAPVPEPQPCEILEEGDASGTTHTIQTCTTPDDPASVGAHHVDAFVMDGHCTWLVVKLDGKVWWTPGYYQDDLFGWSQPTEAGTFTINKDGTGDFVADADPAHVATLVPWEDGPDGPLCE